MIGDCFSCWALFGSSGTSESKTGPLGLSRVAIFGQNRSFTDPNVDQRKLYQYSLSAYQDTSDASPIDSKAAPKRPKHNKLWLSWWWQGKLPARCYNEGDFLAAHCWRLEMAARHALVDDAVLVDDHCHDGDDDNAKHKSCTNYKGGWNPRINVHKCPLYMITEWCNTGIVLKSEVRIWGPDLSYDIWNKHLPFPHYQCPMKINQCFKSFFDCKSFTRPVGGWVERSGFELVSQLLFVTHPPLEPNHGRRNQNFYWIMICLEAVHMLCNHSKMFKIKSD